MAIDRARLHSVLALMAEDETGPYLQGYFIELVADILGQFAQGTASQELTDKLRFTLQDLNNVNTILVRLNWYKTLWDQEGFDNLWRYFAACDINLFYIELRSIFDYIAQVIRLVSDCPGQVTDKGFRKLRNWVNKGSNDARIGQDLAEFVRSCSWFDELRGIRDAIVHQGSVTLAFPEKNRLLFQVYGARMGPQVHTPLFMYNEHVIDF